MIQYLVNLVDLVDLVVQSAERLYYYFATFGSFAGSSLLSDNT